MLRELAEGIAMFAENERGEADRSGRIGKVFSAGVDIGEYTGERAFSMLDAFHAACIAMVEAPQPVLVVVDGAAIGGGAELVGLWGFGGGHAARAICPAGNYDWNVSPAGFDDVSPYRRPEAGARAI